MLKTLQNIFEGLTVREAVCTRHVAEELPFLALEKVLMELTKRGKSRQVNTFALLPLQNAH